MTNFIKQTIALAKENVKHGGRPFACLIVQHGHVIAQATNQVAQTKDPTAHAEIVAIREACTKLGTEHLTDCEFLHSCSSLPHVPGSHVLL
ncbi:nucleoside deaminase [Legionella tunisiensis]|uniref:nucleoside deaminase n=1 Tax=Legionella tunisiensis TaxID=1034944 RepID=UPI0002DE99AF|nr:deaminase [Legionella tunisiensis]